MADRCNGVQILCRLGIRKLYLSAILDLYDKRIVAYKIGNSNNNQLVFDNFDEAVMLNPNAHPLFYSDRGFQYTSKTFYNKLQAAKMRQSMSRVGRCVDNGPMEGFWGTLKSEMYYLRRFTDTLFSKDFCMLRKMMSIGRVHRLLASITAP